MIIGTGIGIPFKISRAEEGIFTDGDCTWRLIADDDEAFNWQHTLTELGFDGVEDTDFYTPLEIE